MVFLIILLLLVTSYLPTVINCVPIFYLGLAGVCATLFHDGAMNPIEGVSSN